MTITSEVVETKLEDEFFVDEDEPEEGIQTSEKESGDASLQKNEGKKVAKGYVVPKGVAVEELKNYSGECRDNDAIFCIHYYNVDSVLSPPRYPPDADHGRSQRSEK